MHGTILDPSHCWLITIGDNVTMAPRVHILAHDASTCHHLGYARIGRIDIGNNVFIGADTVVLPGVYIGSNSPSPKISQTMWLPQEIQPK